MQRAVARISAALLFVFVFSTSSKNQIENPPSERVWFAVEERPRGRLRAEPFAVVTDGKLTPFPSACTDDSSANSQEQQPASSYLEPGRIYTVLYGGAEAGQVRLGDKLQNLAAAQASYDGELKIQGRLRALATNQPPAAFRVESRQAATHEERTEAVALAKEIFRQHGIPSSVTSKVHVDFLTRTVLEPSPLSSWIGAFTLDSGSEGDLQHNLFFIAEQGSQGLQADFIWIRLSETMDEDEAAEFVDHADLFGDGHDEVVLRLASTPNHRYAVYQKSRDGAHWEQIFMTEALECR
jgi:hypothetical protein